MDDRDRLNIYLIIKSMRSCTAQEIANLSGVAEHEVARLLGELVGENIATEYTRGARITYTIGGVQEKRLTEKAADIIVRLRGVS